MKETLAIKFKNEWNRLRAKRSSVEHEVAKLAADVRAQFVDDAEAVDWCGIELGMSAVAARAFLGDGESWDCVRNVDHWVAIGGVKSARIIASLTKKQRLVVLGEAVAKADERKRPLSSTQVRDIAWRHGFVVKEAPKVTEAKKAAALTAFVNRLYALGISGLPPMPSEIKAIVKPPRAHVAKAA